MEGEEGAAAKRGGGEDGRGAEAEVERWRVRCSELEAQLEEARGELASLREEQEEVLMCLAEQDEIAQVSSPPRPFVELGKGCSEVLGWRALWSIVCGGLPSSAWRKDVRCVWGAGASLACCVIGRVWCCRDCRGN